MARKLYKDGFHWQVDKDWIKKKILETYTSCNETDLSRELVVSKSISNYGQLGYIFFAVNGSPPKGCAIYSPDRKELVVFDAWLSKKRIYNNIIFVLKE